MTLKRNTIFFIAIFLLITTVATYLRVNGIHTFQGDTGQLYLMTQNLFKGFGAYNPIQPGLNDFVFGRHLNTLDPEIICAQDFYTERYSAEESNHFRFHAYFILYPISFLLTFIKVDYLIHWLNIFAFTSTIAISYLIIRKYSVKRILALSLALSISSYPAWSWSIIGQPYVDRLYLPFGLLLIYFINLSRPLKIYEVIIILISGLIVEKAAIYNTIFISSYFFFYFTEINNKKRIQISFILLVLVIYLLFLYKYYMNNPYYGTSIPNSPLVIFNNLLNERFRNGIFSLLMTSAPLLIPSLFIDKRLTVIGLILLLPNIFGNIGGAEKVQFVTHYHTLYTPFLIYIYISSISKIYAKHKKVIIKFLIITYIILLSIFYLNINFDQNQKINMRFEKGNNYLYDFYIDFLNYSYNKNSNITSKILQSIPPNSKISASETALPYLYNFNDLYFYPLNLGYSEYLIFNYQKTGNQLTFKNYFGNISQEHNEEVNKCLEPQIQRLYDITKPVFLDNNLVILKKISHP